MTLPQARGFVSAMANARTKNRPLSPHLQIWKWGPHMFVSILHRVTGDGMAFAGLAVLLWWLGALAGGPASYATFTWAMTTPIGYLVLVGISWAFFSHMCSGLRHLVLDTGAGYELTTNKTWALFCPVAGVLLTVAFWAILLLR